MSWDISSKWFVNYKDDDVLRIKDKSSTTAELARDADVGAHSLSL